MLDESIGNWELGIELINEEWKSLNISRIVEIKKCGDTCYGLVNKDFCLEKFYF